MKSIALILFCFLIHPFGGHNLTLEEAASVLGEQSVQLGLL